MRRIIFVFSVFLLPIFFLLSVGKVSAQNSLCEVVVDPGLSVVVGKDFSFKIKAPTLNQGEILDAPSNCQGDYSPIGNKVCYQLRYCVDTGNRVGDSCDTNTNHPIDKAVVDTNLIVSYSATMGDWPLKVWLERGQDGKRSRPCAETRLISLPTSAVPPKCEPGTFIVEKSGGGTYTFKDDLSVKFDGSKTSNFSPNPYGLWIESNTGGQNKQLSALIGFEGNLRYPTGRQQNALQTTFPIGKLPIGNYYFVVSGLGGDGKQYCKQDSFRVGETPGESPGTVSSFKLCSQAANFDETNKCNDCLRGQTLGKDQNQQPIVGIWTAVGCVPTSPQGIVQSILRIGLGMAGGIVVLSVLAGAFMLATSAGNPKQVEEAQQLISSAIIGLLFVVFSVIILQFIGVQVLHIPGFGGAQ